MVKPLTVYKASAGSGKTFTLAVEYIKLLVKNPMNYRNILAVTFTNKATEEMKMRILSQLYGIWKQLPESAEYQKRIIKETGMDKLLVCQRAGEALHLLLHNYNYFRVETIDTFFQSVLRNLARELDLTANLRIGLNDTQVEEQAVDRMIDSLTHSDIMLQWVLKYIMENISDDKSWNIIGQVKQFGRTIFRDIYKEQSKTLNKLMEDGKFMDGYINQMRQIRNDAKKYMEALADNFIDILESEGVRIEDLNYGKSGVAGFFLKLKEGQMDESIVGKRVADCMEDTTKWYNKRQEKAQLIHALAEESLIPLLRKAVMERPRQWKLYKSADLTMRHLNQLRLLGSIEQKVRSMNQEANRFLLSDTQQLLHSLIKDSDTPFIFEKIGTQLEHIMIDEFQDTSTIQWQNFKVLLMECLSHVDSENLIVGDVKQSIYRWRSGDWRLLNAIDSEFPHAESMMEIKPLDTNYRSCKNIIHFNNAFFTEAARQEYEAQREDNPTGAEQLKQAYIDVEQKVPDNHSDDGIVNIQLLPQNNYQENTLNEVVGKVKQLIGQGVRPQDIAILVRTNSNIPIVANYFMAQMPEIPIVSDEAFRLEASVSVILLVKALYLLVHPEDMIAKATVAKIYQKAILENDNAEDELLIRDIPLDNLLPDEFTSHYEELRRKPLYELVEHLYNIFNLSKLNEQSSYICAFYDQLDKFSQENTTDIEKFVKEWEEAIRFKTIQSTETNGIRILSIHKSKGLEFDHVIIPFCDWKLEHPDILWCQPNEEPFNVLPIVPIDYSGKQMRGTIYERNYLDEHLQITVDNLNLLYVAFTRATKSLTFLGHRNSKNTRSAIIENVLPKLNLNGEIITGEETDDEALEYSYGVSLFNTNKEDTGSTTEKPDSKGNANPFQKVVRQKIISIETFKNKSEFRQSNKSREFIEGDDDNKDISYIKIGSILHEVFSRIRTTADIDTSLQQLKIEGIINNQEITQEKIKTLLYKRLEDNRIKEWFSDRWKLFNECNILSESNGNVKILRPDRVITDGNETHVIDFKFGNAKEEYYEQVKNYISLLRSMGLPNVRGWLWYVYKNKIQEVK